MVTLFLKYVNGYFTRECFMVVWVFLIFCLIFKVQVIFLSVVIETREWLERSAERYTYYDKNKIKRTGA